MARYLKYDTFSYGGDSMKKIGRSMEQAACPKCQRVFQLDVICQTELKSGNISRNAGIGYLMQLKCRDCNTIFPYIRFTESNKLNEIIEQNSDLIEKGITGKVGIKIAQEMIATLEYPGLMPVIVQYLKAKKGTERREIR